MKDVNIVRIGIIAVSIYILLVIICAWNGYNMQYFEYVFGHSAILDSYLLFSCLSSRKYHCKYMRFLCYNLLFVDAIGLLDSLFTIFPTAELLLYTLSIAWSISAIITIVLAVRHFVKVQRLKNKTTIYEEYKTRNGEAK